MSNLILDQYQEVFLNKIAESTKNYRSICCQSATGSGKTVVFSTIAARFLQKTNQDVIIFCDSDDIFNQTRKTLFKWYNIDSDTINAKSSQIKRNTLFGQARVFVSMVETFDRRSSRDTFLHQVRDVGLVIVDECHIGNFIKIYEHFPFALKLGFTATPISSDKKKPLNKYYESIVCGPPISELIEVNRLNPLRGVVRDLTYTWRSNIDSQEIEREEQAINWKGEDHNADIVGEKLCGKIQIKNVIDAIVTKAPGKKIICFNQNIKHSELVTKEMRNFGLNARHLDGNCGEEYKKEIKDWLHKTSNGILCNVGMTTKGFDEPSVECVVLNYKTKSKAKYNQTAGRCVRPYQYPDGSFKEYGIVLDMCDNVNGGGHGQWSDFTDWEFIFKNPAKKREQGVAPSKECPECLAVCPASARICRGIVQDFFSGDMIECGYEFPIKEKEEDDAEGAMILVSKEVDVRKIIEYPKFQSRGDFFTFHETIRSCAYYFRESVKYDFIDRDEFETIWLGVYDKIIEWQKIKGEKREGGKKYRNNEWYTVNGRKDLVNYLREYGFTVDLVEKEEKDNEKEEKDNEKEEKDNEKEEKPEILKRLTI